MSTIKFLISMCISLSILGSLAFLVIESSNKENARFAEEAKNYRFEILKRFPAYDNAHGYILRDKKTGLCYMRIWEGGYRGGVTIFRIDCPKTK